MIVLLMYPNRCYNEVCYKGTALLLVKLSPMLHYMEPISFKHLKLATIIISRVSRGGTC